MSMEQAVWLFSTLDTLERQQTPCYRAGHNTRRTLAPLEEHLRRFIYGSSLEILRAASVAIDPSLLHAGFNRVHQTLLYRFKSLSKSALRDKKILVYVCTSVGMNK